MTDAPGAGTPVTAPSDLVIEALSREDGKNSTVRVFRDRIEWVKEVSISSLPRARNDPPVIPLPTVAGVKAKKDGPVFSKVQLRTANGPIVFRMIHSEAQAVTAAITALLETAGASSPPTR